MLTSRLKEARLRAGLSQERLGTLAGLDEMSASSRMNQYERGKHTPGFFLMERLAQALHMPTPWFYTRDDDMAELLLVYNALSPELKEKALTYLRELAESPGADGALKAVMGMADGAAAPDGAGIVPADGADGIGLRKPAMPPVDGIGTQKTGSFGADGARKTDSYAADGDGARKTDSFGADGDARHKTGSFGADGDAGHKTGSFGADGDGAHETGSFGVDGDGARARRAPAEGQVKAAADGADGAARPDGQAAGPTYSRSSPGQSRNRTPARPPSTVGRNRK